MVPTRRGKVVLRRKPRRGEFVDFFAKLSPATIGMEACGGAHFWVRELGRLGHTVRLMPPSYVKRGKTDVADAEAICEAVMWPSMRFVPAKTKAQQAAAVELKTRESDAGAHRQARRWLDHERLSAEAGGRVPPPLWLRLQIYD
jgi:transposase